MKKRVLSVLICVVLLATTYLTPNAVAGADELKFAVASDLHYNVPREKISGEIDDSVYWYANRRAAMEDESGFIIDEFLSQCAASDCEYVLISGDLVDNGRVIIQEHYDVAEKFARFEEETGKDVFVINGNHDFGADCLVTMDKFKEIYADFGYDKALNIAENDCSYTADLGSKYRLVALDSCDPTASTEDGMSLEKMNWVHEQCKQAEQDGRYVILMMHHNLLDHLPMQRILSRNFIVRNHLTTATMFADWGVKIVLTGHEHCSDVATYTSVAGNVIYDFATTSLSMYPLAYRVFTLTDEKIIYTSETIESIDTDALTSTVDGFSAEQINLMNSGFNAYSKGFLKAGVRYRLELSLSMEKMGISENAVYYDLENTAVGKLTGLLNMPLYGENSVKSKAASYGIDFPETAYANGWDLSTEFIAAHYAGSESYSLDDADLKALLLTVSVLIRDELNCSDSDALTDGAAALIEAYGLSSNTDSLMKAADSVFSGGGVTPAEYFTVALLSPLLYEFVYDSDGVDDNNGVLSGYGSEESSSKAANIIANLEAIVLKIIVLAKLVYSYIGKAFMNFI